MTILFIPLIPILAIGLIASAVATLVWYGDLSPDKQEEADKAALKFFGKKFQNLTSTEQDEVRKRIS
ncbi:MAG: hypothetical protein JNM67_00270 [Bacteroidetes bacterium]|jgi:hypothetical protein|nr:hypothetical protein [Bacteroidota bacterium]